MHWSEIWLLIGSIVLGTLSIVLFIVGLKKKDGINISLGMGLLILTGVFLFIIFR